MISAANIAMSLLIVVSSVTANQERIASIDGTVLDFATGRPLEAVNVMILGTDFGDATDEQGIFFIEGATLGDRRIDLLVSAIGYEDIRRTVTLPSSEPIEIRIRETFFQMDELVVTGTRTGKVLVNAPIATEVISRQDILDSGARDMSELLEQRSGVVMTPNVEGGMNASMLGIDAKYILVLIDGQPVTGKFNGRIALDQISTAVVDKVEIVKGPSSAMYGSEAMGGVINIITNSKISRPTFSARTRYTGSDEALNLLNVDHGKRDVRLNMDKSTETVRWQADLDGVIANVDEANKYIDVDNFTNLSFRGSIDWNPSTMHSMSGRVNRFGSAEASKLAAITTASTQIVRNSAYLGHSWQINPMWNLEMAARYSGYERNFERPTEQEQFITSEGERELELNLVRQTEEMTINAGTELGSAKFLNDRVLGSNRSLNTSGYYLQADWQATERMIIVAGGRVDANSEIDPVVSPRLALMLKSGDRWKYRAAWGMGFRMPSFMDRYIDWDHTQYNYKVVGNPDLKPEESNGINTGVEYYHPGEYQVTASVYWNRFENMIDDVQVNPGLFTYENLEKVDFRGIELQARWHLSGNWLSSWGYNFVSNKNLASDQPVPNTQPHTASFRLSHKHGGRFGYALKAKVIGPYKPVFFNPDSGEFETVSTKLPTSMILDWDANFTVSRWAKIGLGMRNLLDHTDEEFGPFVGRTFYLELESQLK